MSGRFSASESAAFFLSDSSKNLSAVPDVWRTEEPTFADPVGIDVPAKALDEYVAEYKYSKYDFVNIRGELDGPRVFRESDRISPEEKLSDYYRNYLGGRYVLNCSLLDEQGFFGVIESEQVQRGRGFHR